MFSVSYTASVLHIIDVKLWNVSSRNFGILDYQKIDVEQPLQKS